MSPRNLEGQYAGFLTRAVGLILDYAILTLSGIVIALGTMWLFRAFSIDLATCQGVSAGFSIDALMCSGGRWFLVAFVVVLPPLYYTLFWMLVGQTIGQRVMGVRVVRLDGHQMGFRRSFVRWIGAQICILTFGIGFLWVLVDDRRMGWHDKLARTCVIYSWKALQKDRFVEGMRQRMSREGPASPAESGPHPELGQ